MKKIKRFFEWFFLEVLKLWHKPTQFYCSNKIQNSVEGTKKAGSGRLLVFSNKKEEIIKLQEELNIPDSYLRSEKGFPCLEVIGSKIGLVKNRSNFLSLPRNEIYKMLNKQKTDRV